MVVFLSTILSFWTEKCSGQWGQRDYVSTVVLAAYGSGGRLTSGDWRGNSNRSTCTKLVEKTKVQIPFTSKRNKDVPSSYSSKRTTVFFLQVPEYPEDHGHRGRWWHSEVREEQQYRDRLRYSSNRCSAEPPHHHLWFCMPTKEEKSFLQCFK